MTANGFKEDECVNVCVLTVEQEVSERQYSMVVYIPAAVGDNSDSVVQRERFVQNACQPRQTAIVRTLSIHFVHI